MIDLKNYRKNPEIYVKGALDKGVKIDFEKFNNLDTEIRNIQVKIEDLQNQRNNLSKQIEQKKKLEEDTHNIVEQVKGYKSQIENYQIQYDQLKTDFDNIYLRIPNPASADVPLGKNDTENQFIAEIGNKPQFDFNPLPHWEILEKNGMLDQERSAKVSGSRFYYLRDGLVRLELALANWVMSKLAKKGFRPTIVPNLVKEEAMICTGFFPADRNEIYNVNPAEDNLFLIGTSEVSLVAQHMQETINIEDLPLRYAGFSPCFRREAGSYGKDTKGMIRVHQFEKVEMVSFVKPADSEKEHQLILAIEEEIYQELGIPYRKILICTGDLGAPAAKKYDLEAWMPGMNNYKEITSCSNTTDFQARRGQIKFKNKGEKDILHTLNGTAIAIGRAMVAIVENYQTHDLKIKIPTVIRNYFEEDYL